ncbi:MAG: hypothetical protein GX446_04515, partial [Chthonomonadales bacterium]|nr:hypothetical protein [Chthonomonadales bacterium]
DRNVPTEIAALSQTVLSHVATGDDHSLAVLKGNTLPVADEQGVDAITGAPVPITLTGRDGDGDPLTYHIVTLPSHGTLTGDPPNVTYMSADMHSGSDTFTFRVNDGHADSDPATVSITIWAAQTTLYTIDRSGTITGLVILRQFDLKRLNDNALIAGRTISFSIDGTEVGTGITNAGGDSALNWIITDGPARRTITAAFPGDGAYDGCSDDATLTCETHATKMTGVNREGKITAYRILKAWLWKMDSTPVFGKSIAFYLDGTLLGTNNTRSTGLAQVGYTIADGAGAGARTIYAEWAGDGGYLPSSCTNTLTVLRATPYIWVMPRSVPQGGVARLYAYFRRLADYQKQIGKTVSFKVDGTWVADVVTLSGAEAGIARYQYPTVEPPGAHTIRCEFAGDAWVDSGYGVASLTIY